MCKSFYVSRQKAPKTKTKLNEPILSLTVMSVMVLFMDVLVDGRMINRFLFDVNTSVGQFILIFIAI